MAVVQVLLREECSTIRKTLSHLQSRNFLSPLSSLLSLLPSWLSFSKQNRKKTQKQASLQREGNKIKTQIQRERERFLRSRRRDREERVGDNIHLSPCKRKPSLTSYNIISISIIQINYSLLGIILLFGN